MTDASPWSEISHGLLGDPFYPLTYMEDIKMFYENVQAFLQEAIYRRLNVCMKQRKDQTNKLKVKL